MTLISRGAVVNHQAKVAIHCTVCSCGVATNIDDCAFITSLQDGWSPLLLACEQGRTEIVEILIKHGARLDIKHKVLQFIMCGELAIELR